MAPKPLCGKCGNRHYNFLKCDEARIEHPPVIVRAPREDKLRDWRHNKPAFGGRITDTTITRVDQDRPALEHGRVLHDGKEVRLPKLPRHKAQLTYPTTENQ